MSMKGLVVWIACFPFNMINRGANEILFQRYLNGVQQRIRRTPMIGFRRNRWSRLALLCDKLENKFLVGQGRYGGLHLDMECQMGWPCITFWGNARRDNGWKHDLVNQTWQVFTVELLHHIFIRMDRTGTVSREWEHIHGVGPYPKIIKPGPPYSRIAQNRNHAMA